MKNRIYIASKTKHAELWKALRDEGLPIISTWIDEAGSGETLDYAEFWTRCLSEIHRSTALILYHEDGETPKGSYIEVGAALVLEVPIFIVGNPPGTFVHHPGVMRCSTLLDALKATNEMLVMRSPPADAVELPGEFSVCCHGLVLQKDGKEWCAACKSRLLTWEQRP